MAQTHKGFQTLFDIRHDHQFVDDRVRRFGRNNARLGDTQITVAIAALLGMGNGGALHRPLHRARTATGADIQTAQTQLVAHILGVDVFLAPDRVSTPAHHDIGVHVGTHGSGVTQDLEDGIGDVFRIVQVEQAAVLDLRSGIGNVTHHREQQFGDTGNDPAINKGLSRSLDQLQLDAPILLHRLDIKTRVSRQGGARIVGRRARGQHRQRTAAQEFVQAAIAGILQAADFMAGKDIQACAGINARIDGWSTHCTRILIDIDKTA